MKFHGVRDKREQQQCSRDIKIFTGLSTTDSMKPENMKSENMKPENMKSEKRNPEKAILRMGKSEKVTYKEIQILVVHHDAHVA